MPIIILGCRRLGVESPLKICLIMKIIGTGLQRTGTSSLSTALRQLGFKVIHFPEQLYTSLDNEKMQRYDAYTDFPIPLIYKELDKKYPNSKFVHTIRDEEDWLASIEWLFTTGKIKFKGERPFAILMHKTFYGTNEFDRDIFLAKYRAYNEEVIAYFKHRPEDFLLLNLAEVDDLKMLADFLGVDDPPNTAFPHTNRQEPLVKVLFYQTTNRVRSRARKLYRYLFS